MNDSRGARQAKHLISRFLVRTLRVNRQEVAGFCLICKTIVISWVTTREGGHGGLFERDPEKTEALWVSMTAEGLSK